jgi:membrane associated rhomboid family serine protease
MVAPFLRFLNCDHHTESRKREMIPIGDTTDRRVHSFPRITLLLIAANVLVFLYQLSLGPAVILFIEAFGAVPAELTTGVAASPGTPSPVYLTLVTSMFMHGGLLHIASNMLFLWVFGDNVEDMMGHITFLGFYLVSGLLAGIAHVMVNPESQVPAIGASGAVAGVLAGYLLLFPRAQVRTLLFIPPFITVTRIAAFVMIGIWFVLQLVNGLLELGAQGADAGGVAFWAHIGGFAAGFVMMLLWKVISGRRSASTWG